MLNKVIISGIGIICIVTLSGCANQRNPDQVFVPARSVASNPALIQVPQAKTNFSLTYGNDPSMERAFNQYIKTGKAPNIITEGFVKFAYNAGQQPIVKTTPFQETVISLQPGEKFTNVTSGDPNRWSYAAAVSGNGATQQQNILIKPSAPDISTNLVITTDKRVYNLRLISSQNSQSTRSVSFWYPEEMVAAANEATMAQTNGGPIASVPDVNLNNLNFDYSISSGGLFSSNPSWKPTQVFDDGIHTYIQFPAGVANRDLPAIFVLNSGNKELVNYHAKFPYFVVDKIFKEAVLVMGVGSSQSKVTITNNRY